MCVCDGARATKQAAKWWRMCRWAVYAYAVYISSLYLSRSEEREQGSVTKAGGSS